MGSGERRTTTAESLSVSDSEGPRRQTQVVRVQRVRHDGRQASRRICDGARGTARCRATPGASRESADRRRVRRTGARTAALTKGIGPKTFPTTGVCSVRGHLREGRPRARCTYGRGESGDVVGAVVAPAVDEEGGRTGDAAQVGAVDVLGDARGTSVLAQCIREPFRVESELLSMVHEVTRAKRGLVLEQEVVHLPESALIGG